MQNKEILNLQINQMVDIQAVKRQRGKKLLLKLQKENTVIIGNMNLQKVFHPYCTILLYIKVKKFSERNGSVLA